MSNAIETSRIVKSSPTDKIQSIQIAQIMIGLQCLIFWTIECTFTLSPTYRNMLTCFYTGYPLWATMVFIVSGSLTIVAAKRHTKSLVAGHIGANIVSMLLSIIGMILLSLNLIDILLFQCPEFYVCPLVKSFASSIVIFQMIVTFVQLAISFSLSGLTYNVNGQELSWASAFGCLIRPDAEDPYQDLVTRPEDYEKLALQDIELED